MKSTFRPKTSSFIIVCAAIIVSSIFLLINVHDLFILRTAFDRRSGFGIIASLFFLIASFLAFRKFRFITIENGQWSLRKLIFGRTKLFSSAEILGAVGSKYITYKTRRTVTTYRIYLSDGSNFQVSSDSISDFDLFERKISRFKKRLPPE